jgi:hypothetical protein
MPQTLKRAPDGRVKLARSYTAGQIAVLLGVGHSTVVRLIDQAVIHGFWVPGKRRDRRVLHEAFLGFVRRNPGFRYALDKLDGFDTTIDFRESDELPPAPACPVRSAPPRSAHKPRSVFRGQIPMALTFSASEVGFLLGLSRRSVISMLDRGILRGFRVPASGLTTGRFARATFTWRVPIGWLAKFLRENPAYSYAWNRIRGCELNGDDREANKKAPADSRAEP